MLSKKKKDLIIRKKYIKLEKKQILKKFVDTNLLSENFFQKEKKNVFFFSINKINQFIFLSKSKITRRCNLTNRNRTIIRKYNISQYKLKKLINFGIISGLNSSIW
jgi:ribosomal protein S14